MSKKWAGHFDSTPDVRRKLVAADLAEHIQSFVTNGVRNLGTDLQVAEGDGMTLRVRAGTANINGYVYKIIPDIDGDYAEVSLSGSHPTHTRVDRVVLRLNLRALNTHSPYDVHSITGIASENPVPPELTRNAEIYELSLAKVRVISGALGITREDITDERASTELCGVINSVLGLDSTAWQEQFDEFLARMERQELEFLAHHEWKFDEQLAAQQTTFDGKMTDIAFQQAAIETWYNDARVDITALQTFSFDNLAALPGVTQATTFNPDGSITAIIRKAGGGMVADRVTVFEAGGDIVATQRRYEEDGVTVRDGAVLRTIFDPSGEIITEVTPI